MNDIIKNTAKNCIMVGIALCAEVFVIGYLAWLNYGLYSKND